MSDRTSHIYEGAGAALQSTYTTANNTLVTSGLNCEEYDRINVYLNISAIVSSGVVNVSVSYSWDGVHWYLHYMPDPNTSAFAKWEQYISNSLGTAQGYFLVFPSAAKFFRVRITYVSGTSVAVDAVVIEGKS